MVLGRIGFFSPVCEAFPGHAACRITRNVETAVSNAEGGVQCAISTGTVIDCSIPRVAPPRMNSRSREWP
jgi:hypothetical protein